MNQMNHKLTVSIVWFMQDLRIADNPAFNYARQLAPILPIYIWNDSTCQVGDASKIWLNQSLLKLKESLNGILNIYKGNADEVIEALAKQFDIAAVFCNISHEKWHSIQVNQVRLLCHDLNIKFDAFNGNYLYSPHNIATQNGGHYKVFTPFKNKALSITRRYPIAESYYIKKYEKGSGTTGIDAKLTLIVSDDLNATCIEDLQLVPNKAWAIKIQARCTAGEVEAHKKLKNFISKFLKQYQDWRNYPGLDACSHLSAHLHFGEISPAQIQQAIEGHLESSPHAVDDKNLSYDLDTPDVNSVGAQQFISEIIWREFAAYLLHYYPDLDNKNFNSKFDHFNWSTNTHLLKQWQLGLTGYPIVDAGMRQLWQTGYMHNRVRMITASFLVKNLLIDWRLGMQWFWNCLIDADLANNSMNWQWVAGTGPDAAPYFRVFNPILQGQKFDPNGEYLDKFVPELSGLPIEYRFAPYKAPKEILDKAGVILGKTYPLPLVDIAESTQKAIKLYQNIMKA